MPKDREKSWTATKFVLLGLLAVLIAGGAFLYSVWLGPYFKRESLEGAYAGKLQELFAEAKAAVDANTEPLKSSKRAGKAVWIRAVLVPLRNRNEWDLQIDERMPLVPAACRADTPAEVNSVVIVYARSAKVGYYQTKGSKDGMQWDAYERSAEVWVVDLKKKKPLAHAVFASHVKQEIHLGEDSPIAELDDAQMAQWYAELPE